jgi:hypothetical protein
MLNQTTNHIIRPLVHESNSEHPKGEQASSVKEAIKLTMVATVKNKPEEEEDDV